MAQMASVASGLLFSRQAPRVAKQERAEVASHYES